MCAPTALISSWHDSTTLYMFGGQRSDNYLLSNQGYRLDLTASLQATPAVFGWVPVVWTVVSASTGQAETMPERRGQGTHSE